ncbi:MAG: hypothetical protein K6E85_17370 [Lachnospiraceae bacterium]|nr:hypothetical protein [Lachnospiraceae bacterium]
MADKYDKQSTARLPLVESVIIIAIFAVVSVVIMQMYLSADRIQKKAVNISKATILAENKAEELKNGSKDLETRYYDNEWQDISQNGGNGEKAAFTMTCDTIESISETYGSLTIFKITVKDKAGEELISLDADFISYAAE